MFASGTRRVLRAAFESFLRFKIDILDILRLDIVLGPDRPGGRRARRRGAGKDVHGPPVSAKWLS